ncbi:MAG: hypothetical protein [Hangzhou rhabdovirus 1]|nr:MAG: hypothetical protein [Hangzhou rhabdovirus 1]UHR49893.1 MAG: hypothetical protein [Hangzhou rhabdovirus 1]
MALKATIISRLKTFKSKMQSEEPVAGPSAPVIIEPCIFSGSISYDIEGPVLTRSLVPILKEVVSYLCEIVYIQSQISISALSSFSSEVYKLLIKSTPYPESAKTEVLSRVAGKVPLKLMTSISCTAKIHSPIVIPIEFTREIIGEASYPLIVQIEGSLEIVTAPITKRDAWRDNGYHPMPISSPDRQAKVKTLLFKVDKGSSKPKLKSAKKLEFGPDLS